VVGCEEEESALALWDGVEGADEGAVLDCPRPTVADDTIAPKTIAHQTTRFCIFPPSLSISRLNHRGHQDHRASH